MRHIVIYTILLSVIFFLIFKISFAQAGLSPVSLDEDEYIFETAEQDRVKVTVVVNGLEHPWAVAFLPSGDALITERGKQIRYVHDAMSSSARLDPGPVSGLPDIQRASFKGGLHDIILHPEYSQNSLIYLSFNKSVSKQRTLTSSSGEKDVISILRGKLAGNSITDVEEIYTGDLPSPTGSRMVFDRDGKLYVATGVNFYDQQSQQLDNANGKVLRLNDDGTIPSDNPFVGRDDALPEIYSYGHSTQYGLTVHPDTGAIMSMENGANGGDELNMILPGRNYGWPLVSFGLKYDGTKISDSPVAEGIEKPVMAWVPSITPSGMVFYTGDKFAKWKGNMFFGVIRRGQISGTGGLERVVFNGNLGEIRSESMLTQLRQRVRDVRQGPDGLLYLLTDENDGALLKIGPVE